MDGIEACRPSEAARTLVTALAGTHGANVGAVANTGGVTALMWAAMKGHTATVTALAGTHGANLETVDISGLTALMWAAMKGHTATVTALKAFLHDRSHR